jgi:hypothetical protein
VKTNKYFKIKIFIKITYSGPLKSNLIVGFRITGCHFGHPAKSKPFRVVIRNEVTEIGIKATERKVIKFKECQNDSGRPLCLGFIA